MPKTLGELRGQVRYRLGDGGAAAWTDVEISDYLRDAYRILAEKCHVFWDWHYVEDLPPHFSYNHAWELAYILDTPGFFDYGRADFNSEFERGLLDEQYQEGPGCHTCPNDMDTELSSEGHPLCAAVATIPESIIEVTRPVWDHATIVSSIARTVRDFDSRFMQTLGEVIAIIWQWEGVNKIRKVRIPAAEASQTESTGYWGIARDVTDISDETVDGTWGIPRQIPSAHPIGPERFGLPRRFFQDGTNTRLEHWRYGRPMVAQNDECELPDRFALYLRDYAQAQCFRRAGPGQDMRLYGHFMARWGRNLERLHSRAITVSTEKVHRMGGDPSQLRGRPPRPRLPWQYGSTIR